MSTRDNRPQEWNPGMGSKRRYKRRHEKNAGEENAKTHRASIAPAHFSRDGFSPAFLSAILVRRAYRIVVVHRSPKPTAQVRSLVGPQKTQTPALRQVLCFCGCRSDVSLASETARRGRGNPVATATGLSVTANPSHSISFAIIPLCSTPASSLNSLPKKCSSWASLADCICQISQRSSPEVGLLTRSSPQTASATKN